MSWELTAVSIGTHCLRAFFVRRIPQPRSMYLNPLRDAHARGTLTRAQARIVCPAVQTLEHIVNPLLNAHRLSFLQRLAPDTHWLVDCDDPLLFEARAQEVRASQDTETEGGRGAPLPCRPRRCLRRDLRLKLLTCLCHSYWTRSSWSRRRRRLTLRHC